MRLLSKIIFLTVIVLAGLQAPVHAQDYLDDLFLEEPANRGTSQQETPRKDIRKDLSEIPDEYLDESFAFFDKCEKTPKMKEYYDCECLSVRFLDKRIEKGPGVSELNIFQSINKECVDTVEAAGRAYLRCMDNPTMLPKNVKPTNFCVCYANTYANMYKNSPMAPGAQKTIAVKTRATVACTNPEVAQKLYPFEAR